MTTSTSTLALKCHTGPGCRLHSPTGIASARKELKLATDEIRGAGSIDEMFSAQNRLREAQEQYDATEEGRAALTEELASEDDIARRSVLKTRIIAANHRAEDQEKEFARQFAEKRTGLITKIELNNDHTYDVPTFEQQGDDFYAPTVGSKYTGYRNATDVAKDIRADLKEAEAKGYLPAGLKYSVTNEKGSMYQGIRVEIQGLSDIAQYKDLEGRRYNEEALALQKRVSGIREAYNSSASRPEVDYFSHMYGGHTVIEDENSRKYREKEANLAKARRESIKTVKPIKDSLKASTTADEFMAANGNPIFSKESPDGIRYAKLTPDADVYAFERQYNGNRYVAVYDFSGVQVNAKHDSFDTLLETTAASKVMTQLPKRLLKQLRFKQ